MSIANYMVDEIAVEPYVDDDNVDQRPTYGARVVVLARVEERHRELRTAAGLLVTVDTVVATMHPVVERDRVWIAPFASNGLPRTFPIGFVFVDADARSPQVVTNARKMRGTDGHTEFGL